MARTILRKPGENLQQFLDTRLPITLLVSVKCVGESHAQPALVLLLIAAGASENFQYFDGMYQLRKRKVPTRRKWNPANPSMTSRLARIWVPRIALSASIFSAVSMITPNP